MTGFIPDTPEISEKQVGLLWEVLPHLSRLAVLGAPGLNALQFAAIEAAARAGAVEAEILDEHCLFGKLGECSSVGPRTGRGVDEE